MEKANGTLPGWPGVWISDRTPLKNALAVFIHGFTGEVMKTWDTYPKLLQKRQDLTTKSYEIFLFEYKSTWLSQPSIDNAIAQLRQFLLEVRNQYDTVVLIAHSQGGLIAKLYVIEALLLGEGRDLKIDLIIACATPHLGIFICNLPYVLRSLPLVGRLIRCEQLCNLASWSPSIRKLKQHWNERFIATEPCSPEPSRRYIKSITIAYREKLVREHSAKGFYVDTLDRRGERRHGMTTEKLDLLFYEYLEQHGNPSRVLAEIARLKKDSGATELFIKDHLPQVRGLITSASPPENNNDTSAIGQLLIQKFLCEFPERPLRCVSNVSDALTRYVTRKIPEVI